MYFDIVLFVFCSGFRPFCSVLHGVEASKPVEVVLIIFYVVAVIVAFTNRDMF